MASPASATTPKPLDARRAELRALGLTDAEVSQAIVAEATAHATNPTPYQATTGGPGVGGQGVMSAVVSSFVAVMSYVRGTLPAIKNDCVTLVSGSASTAARTKAGGSLLVRAAAVLLIAYAVRAEWQQHIVSATETANNQAAATAADARMKTVTTNAFADAFARPRCEAKTDASGRMSIEEQVQNKATLDALCNASTEPPHERAEKFLASIRAGKTGPCPGGKWFDWHGDCP